MSLYGTITHPDSSTETFDLSRIEVTYEFGKMNSASAYVKRSDLNAVNIQEGEDIINTYSGVNIFGGVIRDVVRGGGEAELVIDSYERYAMDGQRSAGDLRYENAADTTIYQDAIDDVPMLSAKSLANLNNGMTFVFPFTSPAKRIRTTAEAAGAEVRYEAGSGRNAEVVVSSSLGSDKTTTTLSPANANISGQLSPERTTGREDITHLIMLGAGEARAQTQATIVPDNDSYDYENDNKYQNVTRYTPQTWQDGDRERWDARTNKDITDPTQLGDLGVKLIDEFNKEFVDVDVMVEDETVALGDEFTVKHPEENLQAQLRAVEVTEIWDANGTRYDVTFSNRRLTREKHTEKEVKDIERYNRAFEGTPVTMNTSGGRQHLDGESNYTMNVYYPGEVEYEHRVKLRIAALPYRICSADTYNAIPTHDHSISGSTKNTDTSTAGSDHDHGLSDIVVDLSLEDTEHDHNNRPAMRDSFARDYYPRNLDVHVDGTSVLNIRHLNRESWEVGYNNVGQDADSGSASTSSTDTRYGSFKAEATGQDSEITWVKSSAVDLTGVDSIGVRWTGDQYFYSFDVDKEIARTYISAATSKGVSIDSADIAASSYPSNDENYDYKEHTLDVSGLSGDHYISLHANGGYITTGDGSTNATTARLEAFTVMFDLNAGLDGGGSEFTDVVDLEGYLTPGTYNKIEVVSPERGDVQAHLDVDVYRQILGNG